MARPLMQVGVGQLEELFAKSRSDQTVLRQLEHELQYRQVPRAVSLLGEVQAVLYRALPLTPPAAARTMPTAPTTPAGQPGLWDRSTQQLAPAPVPPVVPEQPAVRPLPLPPAMKPAAPPVVAVPAEDAYKAFKATSGSTWESIEQTRRLLVQRCHPERLKAMTPERRSSALAEARWVNAAYATLSRVRCGGH